MTTSREQGADKMTAIKALDQVHAALVKHKEGPRVGKTSPDYALSVLEDLLATVAKLRKQAEK